MVQMVRVVQVKEMEMEMETVAGDMAAVLDTQETTAIIIMGKNFFAHDRLQPI